MAQTTPIERQVVLVVEDEPLQRMMAVDLVEDAGFKAIEAADADEAVRILESRADIRIILSDIDMPGSMDGMMLAATVRDRWPPIEIILVSGHIRQKEVELPDRGVFFSKPYDTTRLVRTLQNFGTHH
jgi:CheY-like chemotaxis protein